MKEIYLDFAATTPIDPRVQKAMEPFWRDIFANPRSIHTKGKEAKSAVEAARKNIGTYLGVQQNEVVFTSGGTESNNFALLGIIRAAQKEIPKPHIIVSAIEHSSILEMAKSLEEEGVEVTVLPVDENGAVHVQDVQEALKDETVFVSCMYVNNETGSIEPIKKIAEIINTHRKEKVSRYPYLHTDASQAARFLPIKPHGLDVDLMTLDSQKIYGPKGIGLLYIKNGVHIKPLFYGGGQEGSLRSGTENVPSIVGFATALEIATTEREKNSTHIAELKDLFLKKLQEEQVLFHINGSMAHTVPGVVSISFEDKKGEDVVIALDAKKVYASTASACAAGGSDVSHVVLAITKNKERAENVVRFSFGRETTKEDIHEAISRLLDVLKR